VRPLQLPLWRTMMMSGSCWRSHGASIVVSTHLLEQVTEEAHGHCAAKGYVRGRNWNPLTPYDSVAALAMATYLIGLRAFDQYVVVAPEGHVYGFFFERLEAQVLSIFVDYPPTRVDFVDDLSLVHGRRVLLIEDDIVSGNSVKLVMKELARHEPRSVSLYLGRQKNSQQLDNVPSQIDAVYLAEDVLDPAGRGRYESDFIAFFQKLER
jgi:hypothetical protein